MGAIHAVTSWLGRCIDPVTGNPRDAGPGRFDAGNPKAVDQARDRLNELKMSAQKDKDPLRVRDAAAARAVEVAAQPKTLRVVAEAYLVECTPMRRHRWADNWRGSFVNWVCPVATRAVDNGDGRPVDNIALGDRLISDIDTADV